MFCPKDHILHLHTSTISFLPFSNPFSRMEEKNKREKKKMEIPHIVSKEALKIPS